MENLKTPNNIYFRNVGVQTFRHINVFSDVITFEIGQSARETCFQFTFGGFTKSVLKKNAFNVRDIQIGKRGNCLSFVFFEISNSEGHLKRLLHNR